MLLLSISVQVFALFKGMTSPLVGNGPLNAIVFAGYGSGLRWLDRWDGTESGRRPSVLRLGLAGAYGGLLQCVVATPTELVKCQLQVQRLKARYHGPWDCVKKVRQGWVL